MAVTARVPKGPGPAPSGLPGVGVPMEYRLGDWAQHTQQCARGPGHRPSQPWEGEQSGAKQPAQGPLNPGAGQQTAPAQGLSLPPPSAIAFSLLRPPGRVPAPPSGWYDQVHPDAGPVEGCPAKAVREELREQLPVNTGGKHLETSAHLEKPLTVKAFTGPLQLAGQGRDPGVPQSAVL